MIVRPSANILKTSLLVAALGVPGIAQAEAQTISDPDPDSPAGVVYELPLDTARVEAAPPSEESSSYSGIRSENGFSSSSRVPGARESAAAPSETSGDAERRSSAAGRAGAPRAGEAPDPAGTDAPEADDPSLPLAFMLLGTVVVVGVAAGVDASRGRRRPTAPPPDR